jgi:hypothetical protein
MSLEHLAWADATVALNVRVALARAGCLDPVAEVVTVLGCSRQRARRLLSGTTVWKAREAGTLSRFLGVTLDDLLVRNDPDVQTPPSGAEPAGASVISLAAIGDHLDRDMARGRIVCGCAESMERGRLLLAAEAEQQRERWTAAGVPVALQTAYLSALWGPVAPVDQPDRGLVEDLAPGQVGGLSAHSGELGGEAVDGHLEQVIGDALADGLPAREGHRQGGLPEVVVGEHPDQVVDSVLEVGHPPDGTPGGVGGVA